MIKKTDEQAVRDLAYRLWEQRGRPQGRGEEDWLAAEKRLGGGESAANSRAVDESIRESFPASDAPSTHLPDQPPVNAEEKWAAAAATPKKRRAKNAGDESGRTKTGQTDGRDEGRRSP
jgi:hypothetical protein